jgi:hypothetical protein
VCADVSLLNLNECRGMFGLPNHLVDCGAGIPACLWQHVRFTISLENLSVEHSHYCFNRTIQAINIGKAFKSVIKSYQNERGGGVRSINSLLIPVHALEIKMFPKWPSHHQLRVISSVF